MDLYQRGVFFKWRMYVGDAVNRSVGRCEQASAVVMAACKQTVAVTPRLDVGRRHAALDMRKRVDLTPSV